MIVEKPIKLGLYHQPIGATIVTLTSDLAEEKVMGEWWQEECLKNPLEPQPIDRYWNWNAQEIEYKGRILSSLKVAVITGEGNDLAVQGAMMISTEPIASVIDGSCLLVELLFTAPRNRPALRKDGQPFVVGVGTQLIYWATWFSQHLGFDGQLRLDGSPDFLTWYERIGLQKVNLEPIVFENVTYPPMELSKQTAKAFSVISK